MLRPHLGHCVREAQLLRGRPENVWGPGESHPQGLQLVLVVPHWHLTGTFRIAVVTGWIT